MRGTIPYRWGPSETPKSITTLIAVTCAITLLTAITNNLFVHFGLIGPQYILSLSWFGLVNYFWWQPVSYLFVQETAIQGISFFFLLFLFFNMYILWILGTTIIEEIGSRHFLALYFLCGILGGLTATFFMPLTGHYTTLAGPTGALLGLFTVWTMFYAESILMLFFIIPTKPKWLLVGILALTSLISLSQLDLVSFAFYISSAVYGYLYGLIILNLQSPFSFTEPFDNMVRKIRDSLVGLFKKSEVRTSSKIYDLKGKQVLDDEAFVDAMLTKISKYGEKSLTSHERRRMNEISERKMKEKQRQ